MSAHTADSQFQFRLPSLSYIDAKWEEPNLRTSAVPHTAVRQGGLAAWLSGKIATFQAWRLDRQAAAELSSMSNRDLMDIGLSRSDIGRAFDPAFNIDLRQRGTNA
jgi:uncharacterized protein YjiS (DUF1127 family)